MSKKGVKYLVCGNPKSGKTFATKGLKDAYVLNADVEKKYPLNLIHSNIYPYKFFGKKDKGKNIEWSNITNFYDEVRGKLTAYKKIKGSYPKVVVFDTITALYSILVSKNTKTIKNVYGSLGVANTEDIATLNSNVIEKLLIGNGIDVIILAHTNYNAESGLWEIPAEGSKRFKSQGSWLSYCDYASFLWDDGDDRYISHKELGKPCRNLLEDVPDVEPLNDFKINDMLEKIRANNNNNTNKNEI